MRFGYCTGFASNMMGAVNYALLDDIAAAGYDYVEFPLMQLEALSAEEFAALCARVPETGLACDVCCNMFPARVQLTGPDERDEAVRAYLHTALERMRALNARKVVLGSSGARNLPEGMTHAEGVKQLSRVVGEVIAPMLDEYEIQLVMEPIGRGEANFIRTLPEGMEIVRAANHPRVTLLADSVHLFTEREPAEDIVTYAPYLDHIHLCEAGRALPEGGISEGLAEILAAMRRIGYDKTASFEPMPHGLEAMKKALVNVKAALKG